MKKYSILLLFTLIWAGSGWAQSIFRAPFLSYLGRSLEDHESYIGTKVFLEQYPQARINHSFVRYSVPSDASIDAFGKISLPYMYNGSYYQGKPKYVALLTDQFGNAEASLGGVKQSSKTRNQRITWSLNNDFDLQMRRKSDWNNNQLLDYAPGQRINAANTLALGIRRFHLQASSFFFQSKEWGGSILIDPQEHQPGSYLAGYLRDARQWQGNFSARFNGFLEFSAHLTHHDQDLDWQRYHYTGKVRQQRYLLTYTYNFRKYEYDSQLKLSAQYVKDQSSETLDSFQRQPLDQFWRASTDWRINFNRRLKFNGHLNVEQRPHQALAWRPAAQVTWALGLQRTTSLSVFSNSGQRLPQPLNFHLERLRDAYTLRWEARPYEVAHKAGFALAHAMKQKVIKVVLDRTWFKDKIITELDRTNRQLVFRTFAGELRRDALETTLTGNLYGDRKLLAQVMYRWEQWTPDPKLPWYAKHAAQFRLQWTFGQHYLTGHYLIRSPQRIGDLSSFATPEWSTAYQRFDLGYSLHFRHRWSDRRLALSARCTNLFGKGWRNGQLETGLLLPTLEAPYWSDPQLRNVQISIRQEF